MDDINIKKPWAALAALCVCAVVLVIANMIGGQ